MSKLGALGLLEGFGKGMSNFGGALYENALSDAQAMRRENLERLRFNRVSAENDKIYNRNRKDALLDMETARTQELDNQAKAREQELADKEWALKNKPQSSFAEKTSYYEKALAEGRITQEQYNSAMGYSGKEGGMSDKEKFKIVDSLRKDYQSAMEMVPQENKIPFEQWAQKNRPEAWAVASGGQSSPQESQGGNTVPSKAQVDQMYAALMRQDPSTWDSEIQALKEDGRVQAANMLRARLQEDRKKLKQSEGEHRRQDSREQRERMAGQGRSFANTPFGLLEGKSTLN